MWQLLSCLAGHRLTRGFLRLLGSRSRRTSCLAGISGRTHLQREDRLAWLEEGSVADQARLHTHSGWAAGAALLRCPTERALRLMDDDVRIAIKERLGVPRMPPGTCSRVFKRCGRACHLDLREGHHAHCCRGLSGIHTVCRHHPLVHEWAHILTSAGRIITVEQRGPHVALGSCRTLQHRGRPCRV